MTKRVAAVLAGLVLAHVGPAATWLPLVRRGLPGLAGEGSADHVALTFDDGPDPRSTPLFLDELGRLGCRATFFVLGEMLVRHPELGCRIVAEGHELAIHGWRHVNALVARPGAVTSELARAVGLAQEVTGTRPAWYRPPYGVLSAEALAAALLHRLRPVLWTVWARDWTASATPASVMATLRPGLRGGATVLLHDSDHTSAPGAWRSALGALPEVVGRCRALGLQVGPLRDHGVAGARTRAGGGHGSGGTGAGTRAGAGHRSGGTGARRAGGGHESGGT